MTTETLTLTGFLLARIAEDEEIARHATSPPWRYDPMKVNAIDREESVFAGPAGAMAICVASTGPESGQSMIDARHIATHDPARILAECEAKRRIIGTAPYGHNGLHLCADEMTDDHECNVLRALASVYADHPDHDPAWSAPVA